MLQEVKFAYSSRDQLEEVLNRFITLFNDEDFKAYLLSVGNGDFDTVNRIIQDKQKEILVECGVDPEKGINDLARVKEFYEKSDPTMQKLVFVALREEAITNDVTVGYNNPSYKNPVPSTMEEISANVAKFPAMMNDLRTHLQQNPHLVSQMTPQQTHMLRQMILAQQKIQDAQAKAAEQQQQQPQQHAQSEAKPTPDDDDLPALEKKPQPSTTQSSMARLTDWISCHLTLEDF